MKGAGLWQGERPPDEAFVDMGAFGGNTMSFDQWLRWVFIPNVEALIASNGPWPKCSSVGIRATREGDTDEHIAAIAHSLHEFDALFG